MVVFVRLWSISPEYLDVKGLLAVWREGLLAKKVLEGRTKGYRNHPQLVRFKNCSEPLMAINSFLYFVAEEAKKRGYSFDVSKTDTSTILTRMIPVTTGQIEYEFHHLCGKLRVRDPERYKNMCVTVPNEIRVNPVFYIVEGPIEPWEKV